MAARDERFAERIREYAAEYIARESDRTTLVTVTRVETTKDAKEVTVFVTVLPDDKETVALSFLKRHRSGFKNYLKKHAALKYIPFVDFALDLGEKHRQRIDALTRA